ncbi:hypothetical protein ACNQR7_32430 [Mycolicibacterium senegalense]|uniref:hypothetical protein n=1 Tax=Mycolicibacterium senegalense TaxID=1796 RepID=UPI003AAC69FC
MTAPEPEGLFDLRAATTPPPTAKPRRQHPKTHRRANTLIPDVAPNARFDPVPDRVAAAAAAAGWPGIVLPRLNIADLRVYPVIVPNVEVWRQRVITRQRPELDLSTLALWESWTPDLGPMPPESALTIVGFAATGPAQRAAAAVAYLGSLGAGLVVATTKRRPAEQSMWECDCKDVFLAWAPPGGAAASLLVRGRTGPVATARRSPFTRGQEEKMFAWALHTATPTPLNH